VRRVILYKRAWVISNTSDQFAMTRRSRLIHQQPAQRRTAIAHCS
jgi:hypothetical protein